MRDYLTLSPVDFGKEIKTKREGLNYSLDEFSEKVVDFVLGFKNGIFAEACNDKEQLIKQVAGRIRMIEQGVDYRKKSLLMLAIFSVLNNSNLN